MGIKDYKTVNMLTFSLQENTQYYRAPCEQFCLFYSLLSSWNLEYIVDPQLTLTRQANE